MTRSNYVKTICEIGIFAAVGFVLDELQGVISKGLFINGGSIGFAMIAVLIVGFRRGWLPAMLTGLIMGLLDVATSAYILHPAQLMLDYILPYALVGIGCLCKYPFDLAKDKKAKIMWLILATLIGGMAKFMSHYLAGVLFWANPDNFAWGLKTVHPAVYCFVYNIAFIGPSIVLTAGLLVMMYQRVPSILTASSNYGKEEKNKTKIWPIAINSAVITIAIFCFVYFLIDYIKSYYGYVDKENNAVGYDFNPDSMIIFILALFLIVLCVFAYIKIAKKRSNPVLYAIICTTITSVSLIHGIARLIRMYVKGKDPATYWIWFGVGLFTVLLCVGSLVYLKNVKKKAISVPNQQA